MAMVQDTALAMNINTMTLLLMFSHTSLELLEFTFPQQFLIHLLFDPEDKGNMFL
jgi:hypothetical protein